MKQTLLQKAKKQSVQKRSKFVPDKDMEQVALAWCRDEITHTQICKALNLPNTGFRVYSKLALTLKHLVKTNGIK